MLLKDSERQQEQEGEGRQHPAAQVPSSERPRWGPGYQRTALLRRTGTQVGNHISKTNPDISRLFSVEHPTERALTSDWFLNSFIMVVYGRIF